MTKSHRAGRTTATEARQHEKGVLRMKPLRAIATALLGVAITVTFLAAIVPILLLATLLTLYNRVVEPLS